MAKRPHLAINRLALLALIALIGFGCANPAQQLEPLAPAKLPVDENESIVKKVAPMSVDQMLTELEREIDNNKPDFSLGKGDILSISVYDEPDLSLSSVPVRPDGNISFPLIGDIPVAGRMVDDVRQDISKRLQRYVLQPRVSVVVKEFHSIDYIVYGEVNKPGVFSLSTEVSLTEAIARAGGLTKGSFRGSSTELADLESAFIARNGKLLPVDFVRLIRGGDLRFNINIYPGDYINIPSGLSQEIYVLGEVKSPAPLAHRENMPMSRTIAMASGFTIDADLKRIHIIRGSLANPTVIVSDFTRVIKGKAQDVGMEPGDIVYVPPTTLTAVARTVDKIVPTVQAIQLGILLSGATP